MQVNQEQINPQGWPITLSPEGCSSLAVVGHDCQDAASLHATAGEAFCLLVEAQDALQQRICQVCANVNHANSRPATIEAMPDVVCEQT